MARGFQNSRPFEDDDTARRGGSIEDLIARENDPKNRSFLIVLNSINNALLANTATVREIKESLDEHLEQYNKDKMADSTLKDQGRGAWRVLAWVLGLVQMAGLGIWVQTREEIKDIHTAIRTVEKSEAALEGRVSSMEAVTRTNKP